MKNQIMEHNIGKGISRKYAGVKTGGMKGIPVVVSLFFISHPFIV